MKLECEICRRPRKPGENWCKSCCASYDYTQRHSSDVAAVVEWAANRARKFERRRQRVRGEAMRQRLQKLNAELEKYKP